MKTKIIKNQKPISLDVSLKYECPECRNSHYLFLREAQTKNFKIVCECGLVFKPKLIDSVKLKYSKKSRKKTIDPTNNTNNSFIKQAIPYIINLGFTEQEAMDMLTKAHAKHPTDDISLLIKNTLLELRNNG